MRGFESVALKIQALQGMDTKLHVVLLTKNSYKCNLYKCSVLRYYMRE